MRRRALGPRAKAVLEAVPGCALVSVIAPSFASDRLSDLAALVVTFAATRLSFLPTVLVGIAAAGLFRHLFG